MSDKPLKIPVTQAKKMLKLVRDAGIEASGLEVTPDGGLRVMFATGSANSADAALDAWQRGRGDG